MRKLIVLSFLTLDGGVQGVRSTTSRSQLPSAWHHSANSRDSSVSAMVRCSAFRSYTASLMRDVIG
jgi:hypothetical protein